MGHPSFQPDCGDCFFEVVEPMSFWVVPSTAFCRTAIRVKAAEASYLEFHAACGNRPLERRAQEAHTRLADLFGQDRLPQEPAGSGIDPDWAGLVSLVRLELKH